MKALGIAAAAGLVAFGLYQLVAVALFSPAASGTISTSRISCSRMLRRRMK